MRSRSAPRWLCAPWLAQAFVFWTQPAVAFDPGNSFLENFRVRLDFRAMRITLQE